MKVGLLPYPIKVNKIYSIKIKKISRERYANLIIMSFYLFLLLTITITTPTIMEMTTTATQTPMTRAKGNGCSSIISKRKYCKIICLKPHTVKQYHKII